MPLEETKAKGIWWQEGQPDKRLQGEITYGPATGAAVDLFGHICETPNDKKLFERFTLHGVTFDNKRISLFKSFISGGKFNFPGGASCKMGCVCGVVGGHYHSMDEIKFKEVRVQLEGLIDWTCITGIGFKIEENPRTLKVTYNIPSTIALGNFGSFSVRLEISSFVQPDYHSFRITEDCTFIIQAEQMQPFPAFEQYIYALERFLCLAIQRPISALQIIGHTDQPREVIQGVPVFEDFLIIRKLSKSSLEGEKLIPQFFLFNLHDLKPSPATVFEKFVERQEKLRDSMDLYFSTVYNESRSPRVEFLTLAQSLEAYHRTTTPGKYIDDNTYMAGLRKRFWEVIPTPPEIDADFRAALDKKINYLNEFSLRKRLKELAKRHSALLEPLIGAANTFSETVSELRNKLTHPGDGNDKPDEDFRSLVRLSEKMGLLLEVCFLTEVGFAQDQIKHIILNQSQRARRIHEGWV